MPNSVPDTKHVIEASPNELSENVKNENENGVQPVHNQEPVPAGTMRTRGIQGPEGPAVVEKDPVNIIGGKRTSQSRRTRRRKSLQKRRQSQQKKSRSKRGKSMKKQMKKKKRSSRRQRKQ